MNDPLFQEMVEILLANLNGIEREDIKMESHIIEDLHADSLEIYEIVVAIEQKFDLSIPDEDAENIRTVADAYEYIKANR